MMRLCVVLLDRYFQFQVYLRIIPVVAFTRNWKLIFSIVIKLAYQPVIFVGYLTSPSKNSKKNYLTISYPKHKGGQTKVFNPKVQH